MNFIDKFRNILHENEKVIDSASANKKSFIVKRILIPAILFAVVTIILTIVAICNPRHYVEGTVVGTWAKPGYYEGFPLWVLFLVSGILLTILLLVWFISNKASKNYFICLTNKRIIIRHGAFTTDYTYYAIDKVSGNITISCNQSIFDKQDNNCAMNIEIELLPVGHGKLLIWTPSIVNGYEFSKKIDKQVRDNAKLIKSTKE
ncbi:MAG: PH domain-containing protein [Christensenellales bacterium]